MKTYVALLRGINVGGNSKIDMKLLRLCFESLGLLNVRTVINSGNVIFASDRTDIAQLNQEIMMNLTLIFGFQIPTILRDKETLKLICENFPMTWENNEEQKTDILFLGEQVDHEDIIKRMNYNPGVDTLIYLKGAIGWNIQRINYAQSGLKKLIGTSLYKQLTTRNINTVRKLSSLMGNV